MRTGSIPFVVLLTLCGCQGVPSFQYVPPPFHSTVDIPVLLPYDHPNPFLGEGLEDVVLLAERRLNESMGPLDRPVRARIIPCGDDLSVPDWPALDLAKAGQRWMVGAPTPMLGERHLDLARDGKMLMLVPDGAGADPDFASDTTFFVVPPASSQGGALLLGALEQRAAMGLRTETVFATGQRPNDRWWVARNFLGVANRRGLAESEDGAAGADLVLLDLPPAELDERLGRLFDELPEDAWILLPAGLEPGPLPADQRSRIRISRLPLDESLDPLLSPEAIAGENILHTLQTYDAFVALALVVRRLPEASPREQAAWLRAQDPWRLSRGETAFRPLPLSEASVGRPFTVEGPRPLEASH